MSSRTAGPTGRDGLSFLVDANMPRSSIEVVRKRGYTAEDVREIGLRGATDDEIIAHAAEEGQIVVTCETDFGQVLRVRRQRSRRRRSGCVSFPAQLLPAFGVDP